MCECFNEFSQRERMCVCVCVSVVINVLEQYVNTQLCLRLSVEMLFKTNCKETDESIGNDIVIMMVCAGPNVNRN